MKSRAAVLHTVGAPQPYARSKPRRIEEIEIGPPGPGELLVRVRAAGLCHSDLSVINGDRPRPVPMALGHEAAGEVVECGPFVVDLQPGDHVVMVFIPSCGHCVPCMEGRPALCEPGAASNTAGTLLGGGRRLTLAGSPVYHHMGVSAFAVYAVVSRRSAVRIDPELAFDEASLAGARAIVAVDLFDDKLELARSLGATHAVNGGDPDAVEKIRAATGGGTTVTAGLPHPDHRWPLQHVNLTAEERTVKGSYVGSCVPVRDIPRYIALYREGRLPVDRLMSDRLKLEEINEGFDRLAGGRVVRQVVML